MTKYFIENQHRSSFTIFRRHTVNVYNQFVSYRNSKISDTSKHFPFITENDIKNRSELLDFVLNFNPNK